MRTAILISAILSLCITAFYAGMYVGLNQGVIYSLGLETHSAVYRIKNRQSPLYEGELEDNDEILIDENIAHFGSLLRDYRYIYDIPAPWSLSDSAYSFMTTGVEYRLENPRENDDERMAILDQEPSDEYINEQIRFILEEDGELYFSEEETIELIKKNLQTMKEREEVYQEVLKNFRPEKAGDV